MLNNRFIRIFIVFKRFCLLFVLLTISAFSLKNSITIVDINKIALVINASNDFESEIEKKVNLDDDYLHDINANFPFVNIYFSSAILASDCMLFDFMRKDPTPPPEVFLL